MITRLEDVREHSGETNFLVEIEGNDPLRVEVAHPTDRFGSTAPARVSYPSRSNMPLELVEQFASALTLAIQEARELNARAGIVIGVRAA